MSRVVIRSPGGEVLHEIPHMVHPEERTLMMTDWLVERYGEGGARPLTAGPAESHEPLVVKCEATGEHLCTCTNEADGRPN